MALRANLTTKVGKVFTKVTAKLEGSVMVKLLCVSEDSDEFDTVREITENVFFEFEDNRKKVALQVAEDSQELTDDMNQATHIEIDDEIFVINAGDTIPPSMTDVTWKLSGDLYERKQAQYSRL